MNVRCISALSLALSLAGALPFASTAAAEDTKVDAKRGTDDASGPSSAPAKYKEACTQGNTKYAAHDFPGAIEAYRRAIELDPKNPLAHYLLGEAQLAAGSFTEADAAWNRAALESSDKDAPLRAKVLFVLADLRERQKKWEDARAAWQVYLDWAAKYPTAGVAPASGQARQQAIDAMVKLDKSYEVVRQRIAETKTGNTFTDLSKSPPAAK
jgi:tetratricopeptide (TPR) repeat protein